MDDELRCVLHHSHERVLVERGPLPAAIGADVPEPQAATAGPLAGVRVVELASIGPIPYCGMVLSDMGCDVIRVDKIGSVGRGSAERTRERVLDRGRRSIALDLKSSEARDIVLDLVARADVLIEGYRPGVAERLGLGPDECLARQPRLLYGRMTGWGRGGPLSARAGHDINYLALSGALATFGRLGGAPSPPLNTLGDFAGGGLTLAFGLACALYARRDSGHGQVVDAAMVDGIASIMAPFYAASQLGSFRPERGTNTLDTGAPFYEVYACGDGRYVAVGAMEPQFYALLLEGLGLTDSDLPDRHDRDRWPELKRIFAAKFAQQTRDEWTTMFNGVDACVTPVLGLDEAVAHPHNAARQTFVTVDGVVHPAPAPRLARTPGEVRGGACAPGEHSNAVLADLGYTDERIDALRERRVVA